MRRHVSTLALAALVLTATTLTSLAQQPPADEPILPPLPDTVQPLAPPLRLDQVPDTFREDETRGPSAEITTPGIQEDAPAPPAPAGTRSPRPETSAQTAGLYDELRRIRLAPPALDGTPVARPNPLASEPTTEMRPDPRGEITNLFPEGYVE